MDDKTKHIIFLKGNDLQIINIDGKEYVLSDLRMKRIDGVTHLDRVFARPLDTEKRDKLVDRLVENFSGMTTKKELLRELIKALPYADIVRAAGQLDRKKPTFKQAGCLGFKVGRQYLQLIE